MIINDASIKIRTKSGKLSRSYDYYNYGSCYIFYDYEGIFISVSISGIENSTNYLYYSHPSLYTIRYSDKYIIKSFTIIISDSGGNNISGGGEDLNIIICYI